MLDIRTIYHEPNITDYPRAREILTRYPDAERIEVPSHWNIPTLHRDPARIAEWVQTKQTTLVLGVKKGLKIEPYQRGADFIAPSQANGCAMACAYCYVPRRKGFANPITTFVNIEQICDAIRKHAAKQGMKFEPTTPDPALWVYELGTNSDCAFDAHVSDNLRDLVALFRNLPNAKCTFSTKHVNHDLLNYDPQRRSRIRFSLMPAGMSRLVDVRTDSIEDRLGAINAFYDAGYEVNINFAPVIVYDGWLADYARLFQQVDDTLNPAVKAQLTTEIVFLTHNEAMHTVNMGWHPRAEDVLWRPELQENKISGTGGENIRYKMSFKRGMVDDLLHTLGSIMPYCQVRYAF